MTNKTRLEALTKLAHNQLITKRANWFTDWYVKYRTAMERRNQNELAPAARDNYNPYASAKSTKALELAHSNNQNRVVANMPTAPERPTPWATAVNDTTNSSLDLVRSWVNGR